MSLHCAAKRGHIEVVRLLLDRGASVDATSEVGGGVVGCDRRVQRQPTYE